MKPVVHGPIAAFTLAVALLTTSPAMAESATVSADAVKFAPLTVYIEPGDSVSWTNMAGHNVETIDAMVPEGTEKVNSELGADVTVTFDEPGIYIYKCTPHWGSRMGGIVVVGSPDDPQGIMDGYTAAIEEDRAGLLPAKGLIKKALADMEEKGKL